jgi:hypothetical protein
MGMLAQAEKNGRAQLNGPSQSRQLAAGGTALPSN